MKAPILFVTVLFLSIFFYGCKNNSSTSKAQASISDTTNPSTVVLDKLVGTWQLEDGKSFERWKKNSDNTYSSVAFNINESDTSMNESAKIFKENDQWIFENAVKGQNQGKSIRFTSTIVNDTTVQFSNPAHDFPTDINYTVIDANTLKAYITGPNNKGARDTIPFNYKRVKE